MARKIPFTTLDAIVALLLSQKIYGSAQSIRQTAKRCAERLPRQRRHLMYSIINSPDPLTIVRHISNGL
ncbi:hypothetical protein [Pseudomonas sp. SCB32]|uniref:DUF7740 domain-containing protein n=1 Tax=Pseudomonas sp. SCB32 TaxID=2653853 RepID=UPI001264C62D|nr:hypothetical protein [Pseudomonas sp. SCB32]